MRLTERMPAHHTDNTQVHIESQGRTSIMRKKAKWAASVVKKQLQACCTHDTISLDTHEIGDTSELFESIVIQISSPIKEHVLPSLFRGKSFNLSHVRIALPSPDSLTPSRRSVESAVSLFSCSTLKSTKLQHVTSSPNLAAAVAPSTEPPDVHKSGPLPALHNSFKVADEDDSRSYLRVKRHLSGPLPSLPSNPLAVATSPRKVEHVSGPLSSGGKLKQASRFSPPCTNPMKVKTSKGLFPAVTLTEWPEMVACAASERTLQETLSKVTPVLNQRGSQDSRKPWRSQAFTKNSVHAVPVIEKVGLFPPAGVVEGLDENAEEIDANKYYLLMNSWSRRQKCRVTERNDHRAAAKIQAVFRGYRVRRNLVFELSARGPIKTLAEELDGAVSVSTRMSKMDPQRQKTPPPVVCKGWNGSLRTAQDCQTLLRSKQEAAKKRERALDYALSRQNWKTVPRSSKRLPEWSTDLAIPDKPGSVWNWLERAARMGAHNSQNRIYDNDSNMNDSHSRSLALKSTVGLCTTESGSLDLDFHGWPRKDLWPLSLRQQHIAGLLEPQGPSSLRKPPATTQQIGTSHKLVDAHPVFASRGHPGELQEQFKREDECPTAESSISSPVTSESINNVPRYSARRLKFLGSVDRESVGSCVGPIPSLYRLPSPFAGPKVQLQHCPQKLLNSNSMKDATRGGDAQVSVAFSDTDSGGSPAASVRRPFWRP